MSITQSYIEKCRELIEAISGQEEQIMQMANWFADSILQSRMVQYMRGIILPLPMMSGIKT